MKTGVLLGILLMCITASAQDTLKVKQPAEVRFGLIYGLPSRLTPAPPELLYSIPIGSLVPYDDYSDGGDCKGYKLNIAIPSNYRNLKWVAGGLFLQSRIDNVETLHATVGDTQYALNWEIYETGGGGYFGPEIQAGGKHFGVLGSACIGYFSFSRQYEQHSSVEQNGLITYQDDYFREGSSTIGGVINAGLFLKFGPVSFMPTFFTLVTGSSSGSTFNYPAVDFSIGLKL